MTPGAVLLLGWSGFKALVKRPFKRGRALERVLRRGVPERILSLEADDLAARRGASACLACGRCDEVRGAGASSGSPSPADWVLGSLRDLTDADLAAAAPGDEEALARMEAACPAGVPFRSLARSAAVLGARLGRVPPRA
jgi:hypothetical protein